MKHVCAEFMNRMQKKNNLMTKLTIEIDDRDKLEEDSPDYEGDNM